MRSRLPAQWKFVTCPRRPRSSTVRARRGRYDPAQTKEPYGSEGRGRPGAGRACAVTVVGEVEVTDSGEPVVSFEDWFVSQGFAVVPAEEQRRFQMALGGLVLVWADLESA